MSAANVASSSSAAGAKRRLPFESVRVLSFGQALAGNMAASVLAELGADVVKIEALQRWDYTRPRRWPDHPKTLEPSGVEVSANYAGIARSVKSISLDMGKPEAKEVFKRLVAVSDVVLENFSPGVMGRWGLDYEQLRKVKDDIIMLSMPGVGKTGPKRDWVTFAVVISSLIGLTHLWKYPSGTHNDYVGGAHGVFMTLAALQHRARTGRGLFIDLAQSEAGAALMGAFLLDISANGHETPPPGNWVDGSAMSGVFRCKGSDGWVAVECEDERDWAAFCNETSNAALLEDPRFADPEKRRANMVALTPLVERWTGVQTPYQVFLLLQKAGIAAGMVHNYEDVFRDPHLRERGFMIEVTHPDLGTMELAQAIHRMSKTPAHARRAAPRLGQDNEAVLAEWLGLGEGEIKKIVEADIH